MLTHTFWEEGFDFQGWLRSLGVKEKYKYPFSYLRSETSTEIGLKTFHSCHIRECRNYLPWTWLSVASVFLSSGVSSLRVLLAREKDEDSPKLTILLAESLIAVYMCLVIYALAMYDANTLYRLAAHPFMERMFPALFGGGAKKLVNVTTAADSQAREYISDWIGNWLEWSTCWCLYIPAYPTV